MKEARQEFNQGDTHKRLLLKRTTFITIAVIIAVIITTIVLSYDGIIATGIWNVFEMSAIAQSPIDGYADISRNGDLLSLQYEFDGERGSVELYVHTINLDEINGKYTLKGVSFGNAEMLLLKPKESDGFYLSKGDKIQLYAHLDITPEYANKNGETVQIGYFLNDVLYETFEGILIGGGMAFDIIAPTNGDFMVFLVNTGLEKQNYTELTITFNDEDDMSDILS